MKCLYRYRQEERVLEHDDGLDIDCKTFTPSIRGLFLPGEPRKIKGAIARILFQVMTFGKAKIYYVSDSLNLVHTSYVIPKCLKFGFLNKNDYEIGPCFTYPRYRGKGIYPHVLRYICSCAGNREAVFYMIVDEANVASIKGIEKAGFEKCGIVRANRITKRYYLEKKL